MSSGSTSLVHIVGVGPGDVELLTLKAHRLITNWAQVIIYDRLISEDILSLIPQNVDKIYAGKSCKKHEMTQEQINQILLEQAQLGKKTLRLKGGDPFIFGRGGEESLYLSKRNIECEVTAGISAASGISAHLGIPLTHRGLATSVQFITGHQQKNSQPNLDWRSLANEDNTLVIYMGLANIRMICEQLIDNGLPRDIPAIAIENGTTKNERLAVGKLENLSQIISDMRLSPPTIVIIGKVTSLLNR